MTVTIHSPALLPLANCPDQPASSDRWSPRPDQAAILTRFLERIQPVTELLAASSEDLPAARSAFLQALYRTPVLLHWVPRLGKTGAAYLLLNAINQEWQKIHGRTAPPAPLRAAIFILPSLSMRLNWSEQQWQHWNDGDMSQDLLIISGDAGHAARSEQIAQIYLRRPRHILLPYSLISSGTAHAVREQQALLHLLNGYDEQGLPLYPLLIFDEAGALKNPRSRRTRFVTHIDLTEHWILQLDGTPAENRITDLFEQLQIANPGKLRVLVDARRRVYKDLHELDANQRFEYGPDTPVYREASPLWGSTAELTRRYWDREAKRGINLDGSTCQGCSLGRCWTCPHRLKPTTVRLSYCRSCTKPVPDSCRPKENPAENCNHPHAPLHLRMARYAGADRRTADAAFPRDAIITDIDLVTLAPEHRAYYDALRSAYYGSKAGIAPALTGNEGEATSAAGIFMRLAMQRTVIDYVRAVALSPETFLAMLHRHTLSETGPGGIPTSPAFLDALEDQIQRLKLGSRPTSSKFARIHEILGELGDDKAIVLVPWQTAADLLGDYLSGNGLGTAAILHGGRSQSARESERRRFNEDEDCRVAVMTVAVARGIEMSRHGRVGLVIVAAPVWVPGQLEQAIDRAKNFNHPRQIRVIHLLARHTLEPRLHEALLAKRFDIDHAVDASDTAAAEALGSQQLDRILSAI